ncbi:MAG: sulfatase, partial [Planctomycetia bacterium]|nr:sulfatase [Planctomycetia bacterium]
MPHDIARVDPAMPLGRRAFLGGSATAASTAALASLFARDGRAASLPALPRGAVLPALHFAPKAKRVI